MAYINFLKQFVLLKYIQIIVFHEELLIFHELCCYNSKKNVSIGNLTSQYLNRTLLLVILEPRASVHRDLKNNWVTGFIPCISLGQMKKWPPFSAPVWCCRKQSDIAR